MPLTGSQIISRALRAEGIDTVFTIAGDHTLALMDQMAADGFRFVDARHEQAAVDMANAYGRITGTPGVTLFTTPGHANCISGLNFAHHLESPVINISGCAEQNRLGQGASQEIDQVGMARPVTKAAWLVSDPRCLPDYFARAFRTALSGRRGPVHLTVPVDVQTASVAEDEVVIRPPSTYRNMGGTQGDPTRVRDAVALLHSARRAVVVVGNGAYTVSRADLEAFLEVTGLPVFTENVARGVVPDSHPQCHGLGDPRANPVARSLKEADVILFLGKKLDATITFGEPPSLSAEARIIQVEPAAEQIGLARAAEVAILGDVGPVVRQLTDEARSRNWSPSPLNGELADAWRTEQEQLERRAATSSGLHAMAVHQALRPLLDDDDALVFEGSDFAFYAMPYYPTQRPHRWFANGTSGMIGWGLPFALGTQVALPNSRVVVLTGDGSFGFNGMELDTAVRHDLPVVVVMGNDAVWGMDYHQQADLYGRVVATELLPTRYDQMAIALGAHGEYVETAAELPAALERALGAGRPALVNVRTEASPSPITEYIMERKRLA